MIVWIFLLSCEIVYICELWGYDVEVWYIVGCVDGVGVFVVWGFECIGWFEIKWWFCDDDFVCVRW